MPDVTLHDFLVFLPQLLRGAKLTVLLTLVIFAISVVLGLLVALGRMSPYRAIRIPLTAYVEFIRGTPGLVQIYYIFYVFPFWGLTLNAIAAGVLGLSLNYAAYMSEVFRSGIQAVPPTQREAAATIGLNYFQTLRFVILPQAFRVVMAPLVNYLLGALQGHVAALGHHHPGAALHRAAARLDDLQALRDLHRDRHHLFRHLLSGRAARHLARGAHEVAPPSRMARRAETHHARASRMRNGAAQRRSSH